jgi:hypothetical protein
MLYYGAGELEKKVNGNARSSFWSSLDEYKIQRWELKKLLRFILLSATLLLCQGPRPRPLVFLIKTSVKRKDEYRA